jgi:hypothetical protein
VLPPRPDPPVYDVFVAVVTTKDRTETGADPADQQARPCHEGADHRDLAHAIRSCARLRLNFLRLRVYLVDALLRLFRRNAGPRRDRIDLIPPSAGSSAQPAAEDRRIRLLARWSAVLCRWVLPRSHANQFPAAGQLARRASGG